jgi:integrase
MEISGTPKNNQCSREWGVMMQGKITKKLVDSIQRPESGQVFLRDSELAGFGIRITPTRKTFILEKRMGGRPRRITLGPYPGLSVEDARDLAKEKIGDISKGKDPAQEIVDGRREPTLEDLVKIYEERHLPEKKSATNDSNQIKAYLTPWMSRRLSSIRRKDVASLHAKVGKESGRYAANRLISLLRKMFNLAHLWELFLGENPATGIQFFKEEKRDRFLKPDEIPGMMEALKREPNFYVRAAILTLLLTGQRKSEVLNMKWEDIDLESGTWRIPDTKAGKPHYVPVPPHLLEMFRTLPRTLDNPYVFPGRNRRHLVNVTKAWDRIRKEAKIEDVRIHDLRRTVGSWLASSGASLPLIGKTLGHTQPQTTAIYARMDIEPVRRALNQYSENILMIAEGEKKQ